MSSQPQQTAHSTSPKKKHTTLNTSQKVFISHSKKNSNKSKTRAKIGLALGGGGAKGAAHVGVLKVLESQNIPIDYIAGTNVGAVVGGLYSAGVSLDYIEEMFTKRKLIRSYLTIPLKMRIFVVPIVSTTKLFGMKSYDGLYRGGKFRKFLNKYVPESEQDIKDLKIPFGAVSLDLIDGKVETIRSGNLGKVLQASSAIPILRKPVRLKNGLYVDGGVSVNLPVEQVKQMGADIVIAVNLDTTNEVVKEEQFYKTGSVSSRVISLHLKSIDKVQKELADIVIEPDVKNIGLISSSSEDAKQAITAGKQACMLKLDEINKLVPKQ